MLFSFTVKAQIDTSGRGELANLFQYLNPSNIPTGYLMEWGTDMIDKDDLNGILTDSNFVNNLDLVRMVYADVYSARYNAVSPTMISPDALNNLIEATNGESNLVMIYGQYAITNPNSINNGWLTYNRNRLIETGTGSPYNLQQVWAAYPTKQVYSNTVTLSYNPLLYFNNNGVSISNLYLDFGNGYSLLQPNTSLSNTYADSTGIKIIKIKAVLSNGVQMETQMLVQVEVSESNNSNRYGLADLNNPDFTVPAQAGVHAGCKVYVRRSIGTPANQILKPFIVVEGLDINSALPKEVDNYQVNRFIDEISNLVGYNFSQQLDNVANYDLIFVDWGNGVGDIPGNAVALEAVIDWVNQQKASSNSNQQNVIMGISMGGLISRYCLANMVKRSPRKPTGTRLLLTMDSPHQGSYIPLALQHIAMELPEARGPLLLRLGTIIKTLDRVKNDLLLSPAAQQQLILRNIDVDGTVVANAFLTSTYRPMITFSNPAIQPEYDFRAISNGSQCGIPVLSPGATLVKGTASVSATPAIILLQLALGSPLIVTKFKYSADIDARSLTGLPNHEIIYFRLRRLATLFFLIPVNRTLIEIRRNEPSFNEVAWESVPGGTQSIENRAASAQNDGSDDKFFKKLLNGLVKTFFPIRTSLVTASAFSFVPVTSALDIQGPGSQTGQYIFPVQGTNGSTSSRYIAQEFNMAQGGFNVEHTDFTTRNSRWIFNEMQGNAQTFDCTYDCPVAYNTTISGLDIVCTSATYTINNLNALEIAGVSVSPVGIATAILNPNGTITITAVPNAFGTITLSLAVRIPNCNASEPIVKQIYIGKPEPISLITEFEDTNPNCFITRKFSIRPVAGATSYNWVSACISPTPTPFQNTGTGTIKSLFQINPCTDAEGQFKTRVDAINACGVTMGTVEKIVNFTDVISTDPNCQDNSNPPLSNSEYYFITISPNPVSTSAIIRIKYILPPNPPVPAPSNLMTRIMLYNSGNQMIFSTQLSDVSQYTLHTTSFTPGSYRLLVQSSSGQWLQATLIK